MGQLGCLGLAIVSRSCSANVQDVSVTRAAAYIRNKVLKSIKQDLVGFLHLCVG